MMFSTVLFVYDVGLRSGKANGLWYVTALAFDVAALVILSEVF